MKPKRDPITEKVLAELLNSAGFAWTDARERYLEQSWMNPYKKIRLWFRQHHADILFIGMLDVYSSYMGRTE